MLKAVHGSFSAQSKRDVVGGGGGGITIFYGCPCQVAGLRAYLKEDYENLILVDILCSYAPSVMFFQKYVSDEFDDKLLNYEFRHKITGRKCDCSTMAITTADKTFVRIGRAEDVWQRLIHDYVMCPPHCEHCAFCGLPRFGDFTLGDFWGIEGRDKSIDASCGVSVCLCNNVKASAYLNSISSEDIKLNKKLNLAWLGPNGNILTGKNRSAPPSRDVFFDCITFMSFSKAAGYALNAGHAKYDYLWRNTNTPLQYSSDFLHWHYDPLFWEEHIINGMIVLIVKQDQWKLGRYARLLMARPLLRNRKYDINIKFRIKTTKEYFNFHFSSSSTDKKHIIHTVSLKSEDKTGEKIHNINLVFEPKSDIYDEFMIAASQLTGNNNYIGFYSIAIEEHRLEQF